MNFKLKNLKDQVIVITGASSGIGLATAKMAAERGAKLVLASRNRGDLERICNDIRSKGGQAIAVEADVANVDAVQNIADRAIREFGGFDTWVNNAGISIYGKLTDVPMAEKRRLMDVNFWGVVNGCRAAVPILRERGGAIINIGSIASERAIPIQGIYSASKHAVKAYTDALRMELEADGAPVSVSLIKPGAIDTPYPEHAVSHLKAAPVHTPPVYAPEVVARAILEAAEHSTRDVYVGGAAKFFSLMETFLPRLTDLFQERMMDESHQSSRQVRTDRRDPALFHAPQKEEGHVRGNYPGHVAKTSAYTSSVLKPGTATLIATGLGLAAAAGITYLQNLRVTERPSMTH